MCLVALFTRLRRAAAVRPSTWRWARLFLAAVLAAPPTAARARADESATAPAAASCARARARKDSLFRLAPTSPIPPDERPSFAGLEYFPVDVRYRLVGTMQVYGRRRLVAIPATGDTTVTVERFGLLAASFDGIPFSLEIYRSVEADRLTAFFTDETTGEQTYGGGRYAPVEDLGAGRYVIDFNEAYNPYCAYNSDYVCPLPPPRNHLPFAAMAGEKRYGPDLASH